MHKVRTRQDSGVATAIIDALKSYRNLVRTITFDNGLEFAHHAQSSEALGAKVYFADPYSSGQRGTHEKWNGLLRQDCPKRSCFSRTTSTRLQASESALNNHAQKRLVWFAPTEALAPSEKSAGVALAV